MRSIAQALKELEARIDLILTSPYLRSTQTAQILKTAFDLKKSQVIPTEYLAPTGYADRLVSEIQEKYSETQNVALVGHEPYLTSFISVLTTGIPSASLLLKKGGVCRLSIENFQYSQCAVLEWLLSPAQLLEMGD